MTGKNCRQFRLLTWTLLIGQFCYTVEGVNGMDAGGVVILASYKFLFIRVHDNLV